MDQTFMREVVKANPDRVYFPNLGIFENGIKLNRVMFTIPGTDIDIYWYGFLIALGIVLAMVYCFRRMKSFGISPDIATDCVIGGLVGAILGARIYYIIFSLDRFKTETGALDWKEMINIRDGGLAIYGGLIGAILVASIIAKIRKLNMLPLLDLAGCGFLIGQAIGRWGNFVNQEAFGAKTTLPWGMTSARIIDDLAEYYGVSGFTSQEAQMLAHPCFLYESLWCVLCFVILHMYSKHRKFDGEMFLMYIGLYGLGRFFIEGLRTDSLMIGTNLRVSQMLAGTCVLFAVIMILVIRGAVKRSGDYKFYYETDRSKAQIAEYEASLKKSGKKSAETSNEENKEDTANQHILDESVALDDEEDALAEEIIVKEQETDNQSTDGNDESEDKSDGKAD